MLGDCMFCHALFRQLWCLQCRMDKPDGHIRGTDGKHVYVTASTRRLPFRTYDSGEICHRGSQ